MYTCQIYNKLKYKDHHMDTSIKKEKKFLEIEDAHAVNRTRASSMATTNSTTRPHALLRLMSN
jgi:hypothetical protein